MLALRQGTLKLIDLGAINGIISFPSLHAAVAVIVPFTLRWNKPLFWPIGVLDSVMLISAIPSGNHYLTDVLGGLAVAVLAIVCGRRVQESFDRLISGTVWNLQSSVQSRRSRISTGENSLRSAQFGGCISRSSTRTFLAGIETLSGYAARAPYGPAVSASDRTRSGTTRCATYGRAAKMVKTPQAPQGAPSPLPPPCRALKSDAIRPREEGTSLTSDAGATDEDIIASPGSPRSPDASRSSFSS